jgi:hypothetical protein
MGIGRGRMATKDRALVVRLAASQDDIPCSLSIDPQ